MRAMKRTVGVVEEGRVTLPDDVRLPEGAQVIVEWDEAGLQQRPFLEGDPLTEEDVRHDINWATGDRWQKTSS
jgi:hypothetical protein